MLIKHPSDSSDAQLIDKELSNQYENSAHAQTHAQEICTNLINLHITSWKGNFQSFLSHGESQWLFMNKNTPISDQE